MAPAQDGDGNPISGFYITPEGKVVDSRTAIEKMTGAQSKAAPAAPSFDSEQAARAAGKKAGDVVTLKGIGKVKLK